MLYATVCYGRVECDIGCDDMGRVIIIGSINMDVVTRVPRFPLPGETIFGSELHFIPGGKGANQAVAASRLGDEVYLVGKLGRDAFGNALHQFLQKENLNLEHLSFSEILPTGTAIISVDDSSENNIVVVSGSNWDVQPSDVDIMFQSDDVVVAQFELPQATLRDAFARAKQVGATTILNPAPAIKFEDGLKELVDYLVVNETESSFFAETSVSQDAEQLASQAQTLRSRAEQTIILTRGKSGVLAFQGETVHLVDGVEVEAVDTTGAGDCFVGALAVAISERQTLPIAIAFANRAAAISVQKLGAATSMPYRKDLS